MLLRQLLGWFSLVLLVLPGGLVAADTELAIRESQFLINGKPTFLLGISYYGALGAPESFVDADLADIERNGFNWIRIWATWNAFGSNVSAVNADGSPREPYLARLKKIVADCRRRGLIVDVTLSRDDASGSRAPMGVEEHARAVETLVRELKPFPNWYLDLANERSVRDARFVPQEILKVLRDKAKELDPNRLITASDSSSDDKMESELAAYLNVARVDFVAPHRPRFQGCADQTEAVTRRLLARMKELGRAAPIHYQEPFRRGWGKWEPQADDYLRDLAGAIKGGAAGWCFHNGAERGATEQTPRRSFDLRERRLFDQLDAVERTVLERLKRVGDDNGK